MKKSKKKGYAAFKLGLEKAFNNVTWDFLKSCLLDFGFPDATTRLIMHCVTTSTFSLLWNGNKMPPFKPSYRLIQGDPFIPLFFSYSVYFLVVGFDNGRGFFSDLEFPRYIFVLLIVFFYFLYASFSQQFLCIMFLVLDCLLYVYCPCVGTGCN
jgi:hypothetical protein